MKTRAQWWFGLFALALMLAALVMCNHTAAQMQVYEVRGILHCHSIFSDGSGTPEQIAKAGNDAGLDFLVLTDHDKLQALEDGKEGWYGSTLLLVGQETTTSAGHLLTLGVPADFTAKGLSTQATLDKINQDKGIGILAHPINSHYAWKDWDVRGYQGIELINLMEMCESQMGAIKLMAMEMFLRGKADYDPVWRLALAPYPKAQIERWEQMIAGHKVVMIGGSDAHARYEYNGAVVKLPAYKETFQAMQTHLLLPEPLNRDVAHDKKLIDDAIAAGHSYIGYEVYGDTKGFRFYGGGARTSAMMGDSIPYAKGISLAVIAPSPKGVSADKISLRILRNGVTVAKGDGKGLDYQPDRPGAYRSEAWLTTPDGPRVWVFSNPIYLTRGQ